MVFLVTFLSKSSYRIILLLILRVHNSLDLPFSLRRTNQTSQVCRWEYMRECTSGRDYSNQWFWKLWEETLNPSSTLWQVFWQSGYSYSQVNHTCYLLNNEIAYRQTPVLRDRALAHQIQRTLVANIPTIVALWTNTQLERAQ